MRNMRSKSKATNSNKSKEQKMEVEASGAKATSGEHLQTLIEQGLDKDVVSKLDEFLKAGKLSSADLIKNRVDSLKELPVANALTVLNQYGSSNLNDFPNKGAYFDSFVKMAKALMPSAPVKSDEIIDDIKKEELKEEKTEALKPAIVTSKNDSKEVEPEVSKPAIKKNSEEVKPEVSKPAIPTIKKNSEEVKPAITTSTKDLKEEKKSEISKPPSVASTKDEEKTDEKMDDTSSSAAIDSNKDQIVEEEFSISQIISPKLTKECEIFIGKIPFKLEQEAIISLFKDCGKIWDFRLVMNMKSGLNKGFGFLMYATKEAAKRAIKKYNNYNLEGDHNLIVDLSEKNFEESLTLLIGNIPQTKTKEEILKEFSKTVTNISEVTLLDKKQDQNCFCLLTFKNHKLASAAKKRLQKNQLKFWDNEVTINWAKSSIEAIDEDIARVTGLFDEPTPESTQLSPSEKEALLDDTKKFIEHSLHKDVILILDEIFKKEKLSSADFDESIINSFKELPSDESLMVLDYFKESNLDNIPDKKEHLVTVLKMFNQKGPEKRASKGPSQRDRYTIVANARERICVGYSQSTMTTIPDINTCELFIGKIPLECREDDLLSLFEKHGTIWDLRLKMNTRSAHNRGYAFITYTTKEAAQTAMDKLNNYEIKEGKRLSVELSQPNIRLIVRNIPTDKKKDELHSEFSKLVEGLTEVTMSNEATGSKKVEGHCHLKFTSCELAKKAKEKLCSSPLKLWDTLLSVNFANSLKEANKLTVANLKVLRVDYFSSKLTANSLRKMFEPYGPIDHFKKQPAFALITFKRRKNALDALKGINEHSKKEGSKMLVAFDLPVSDEKNPTRVDKNKNESSNKSRTRNFESRYAQPQRDRRTDIQPFSARGRPSFVSVPDPSTFSTPTISLGPNFYNRDIIENRGFGLGFNSYEDESSYRERASWLQRENPPQALQRSIDRERPIQPWDEDRAFGAKERNGSNEVFTGLSLKQDMRRPYNADDGFRSQGNDRYASGLSNREHKPWSDESIDISNIFRGQKRNEPDDGFMDRFGNRDTAQNFRSQNSQRNFYDSNDRDESLMGRSVNLESTLSFNEPRIQGASNILRRNELMNPFARGSAQTNSIQEPHEDRYRQRVDRLPDSRRYEEEFQNMEQELYKRRSLNDDNRGQADTFRRNDPYGEGTYRRESAQNNSFQIERERDQSVIGKRKYQDEFEVVEQYKRRAIGDNPNFGGGLQSTRQDQLYRAEQSMRNPSENNSSSRGFYKNWQ